MGLEFREMVCKYVENGSWGSKCPRKDRYMKCKKCGETERFGYIEESDYEVSSDDEREICEGNLISSSGYYYCQSCKTEM